MGGGIDLQPHYCVIKDRIKQQINPGHDYLYIGALIKAQEENTHWDFPLSPEETETIVLYPDFREMTEGCQ